MDLKENELSFSDYAVIARLHCYHIGKGFLASLGVPFLTLLYASCSRIFFNNFQITIRAPRWTGLWPSDLNKDRRTIYTFCYGRSCSCYNSL